VEETFDLPQTVAGFAGTLKAGYGDTEEGRRGENSFHLLSEGSGDLSIGSLEFIWSLPAYR
jgi:hypothetical protein